MRFFPRSRAGGAVAAVTRGSVRAMRRAGVALAAAALLPVCGCGHLVVLHDPLSAAEHNDLGVAYERQGKLALAEREFGAATHLDPRYARAWINFGNTAAATGRWKTAARRYRRALLEGPRSADAMNNLAFALLQLPASDLEEAERLARAAIATGGGRDSVYRATLAEVRRGREGRR